MERRNEIDRKFKIYDEQIFPSVKTARGMIKVLKMPNKTMY